MDWRLSIAFEQCQSFDVGGLGKEVEAFDAEQAIGIFMAKAA